MGKKKRLFIDKITGSQKGNKCPVCGEQIKMVRLIKPYHNEDSGSWRYNLKMEHFCKCNTKEVFAGS